MEESKNNEEVDEMVNKNVIKKIWLMSCDFMISRYFYYNEKVIVQCAYDIKWMETKKRMKMNENEW